MFNFGKECADIPHLDCPNARKTQTKELSEKIPRTLNEYKQRIDWVYGQRFKGLYIQLDETQISWDSPSQKI